MELVVHGMQLIIRIDLLQILKMPLPMQIMLILNIPIRAIVVRAVDLRLGFELADYNRDKHQQCR